MLKTINKHLYVLSMLYKSKYIQTSELNSILLIRIIWEDYNQCKRIDNSFIQRVHSITKLHYTHTVEFVRLKNCSVCRSHHLILLHLILLRRVMPNMGLADPVTCKQGGVQLLFFLHKFDTAGWRAWDYNWYNEIKWLNKQTGTVADHNPD